MSKDEDLQRRKDRRDFIKKAAAGTFVVAEKASSSS